MGKSDPLRMLNIVAKRKGSTPSRCTSDSSISLKDSADAAVIGCSLVDSADLTGVKDAHDSLTRTPDCLLRSPKSIDESFPLASHAASHALYRQRRISPPSPTFSLDRFAAITTAATSFSKDELDEIFNLAKEKLDVHHAHAYSEEIDVMLDGSSSSSESNSSTDDRSCSDSHCSDSHATRFSPRLLEVAGMHQSPLSSSLGSIDSDCNSCGDANSPYDFDCGSGALPAKVASASDLTVISSNPVLPMSSGSSFSDISAGVEARQDFGSRRLSRHVSSPALYAQASTCISAGGKGNLTKTQMVCLELYTTEQSYVHALRETIEGYLYHLNHQGMTGADIECIFGNLEAIYDFSKEVLNQLEQCYNDAVAIAQVFVHKAHGFITLYAQYCTNYPEASTFLSQIMHDPEIGLFFQERQKAIGHALPLESYLLKPVQRIMKYHLLLKDILKGYSTEDEDFEAVRLAASSMADVAEYINEMKRLQENAYKVQMILNNIVGLEESLDIYDTGKFILENTFRVQGARGDRVLFLFERVLLLCKIQEDGFYFCKDRIQCSNMMLFESVPKDPLAIQIILYDNQRMNYVITARSLEIKKEWTQHMKRVILENFNKSVPLTARQAILGPEDNKRSKYDSLPIQALDDQMIGKAMKRQPRSVLGKENIGSSAGVKRESEQKKDGDVNLAKRVILNYKAKEYLERKMKSPSPTQVTPEKDKKERLWRLRRNKHKPSLDSNFVSETHISDRDADGDGCKKAARETLSKSRSLVSLRDVLVQPGDVEDRLDRNVFPRAPLLRRPSRHAMVSDKQRVDRQRDKPLDEEHIKLLQDIISYKPDADLEGDGFFDCVSKDNIPDVVKDAVGARQMENERRNRRGHMTQARSLSELEGPSKPRRGSLPQVDATLADVLCTGSVDEESKALCGSQRSVSASRAGFGSTTSLVGSRAGMDGPDERSRVEDVGPQMTVSESKRLSYAITDSELLQRREKRHSVLTDDDVEGSPSIKNTIHSVRCALLMRDWRSEKLNFRRSTGSLDDPSVAAKLIQRTVIRRCRSELSVLANDRGLEKHEATAENPVTSGSSKPARELHDKVLRNGERRRRQSEVDSAIDLWSSEFEQVIDAVSADGHGIAHTMAVGASACNFENDLSDSGAAFDSRVSVPNMQVGPCVANLDRRLIGAESSGCLSPVASRGASTEVKRVADRIKEYKKLVDAGRRRGSAKFYIERGQPKNACETIESLDFISSSEKESPVDTISRQKLSKASRLDDPDDDSTSSYRISFDSRGDIVKIPLRRSASDVQLFATERAVPETRPSGRSSVAAASNSSDRDTSSNISERTQQYFRALKRFEERTKPKGAASGALLSREDSLTGVPEFRRGISAPGMSSRQDGCSEAVSGPRAGSVTPTSQTVMRKSSSAGSRLGHMLRRLDNQSDGSAEMVRSDVPSSVSIESGSAVKRGQPNASFLASGRSSVSPPLHSSRSSPVPEVIHEEVHRVDAPGVEGAQNAAQPHRGRVEHLADESAHASERSSSLPRTSINARGRARDLSADGSTRSCSLPRCGSSPDGEIENQDLAPPSNARTRSRPSLAKTSSSILRSPSLRAISPNIVNKRVNQYFSTIHEASSARTGRPNLQLGGRKQATCLDDAAPVSEDLPGCLSANQSGNAESDSVNSTSVNGEHVGRGTVKDMIQKYVTPDLIISSK